MFKKESEDTEGKFKLRSRDKRQRKPNRKTILYKAYIMFMWAQTRRWGCAKTEIGNESLFSSLVTTIFENDQTEHIIHDWQINF